MKKLSLPTIAILLSLFIGCASQPDACFLIPSNLVDHNEEIVFDNCTFNATNFSWEFGDGTSSDIFEPTHQYPNPGEYLVLLTASGDKAGQQDDTFSEVIKVGNRMLSTVEFNAVPATNDIGQPWDNDSTASPDLLIRFKADGAANWNYSSAEFPDQPVPSVVDLSMGNMEFTQGLWTIELVDVDGMNEEIMGQWMVNTDSIPTGMGGFPIVEGATDMFIRYSLQ